MGPRRRGSGGPTASRSTQPRLAFNQGKSNRITKSATAAASEKEKKLSVSHGRKPERDDVDEIALDNVKEHSKGKAAENDGKADLKKDLEQLESKATSEAPPTDEELRAAKIKDSEIKAYWRAKENERKAPRVHQQDLSVEEKILREWDMSGQYGPSVGISREKRWQRAHGLGLDPPIEVLAILLRDGKSKDSAIQRAQVDKLLSSRFVET